MIAEDFYEQACERLQDNALKLTPQRQTILQVFMDNAKRHLSAEDIYLLVKDDYPEIGLATIYRTLDVLSEIGVIRKNDFGDGRSRYEIADEDEHHHHLICLKCGNVTEFDEYLLESLEAQILKKSHFQVINHDLKFYGYCEKCSKMLH